MKMNVCENCEYPVASGGGSYCFYHKQELCIAVKKHCYMCGKILREVK